MTKGYRVTSVRGDPDLIDTAKDMGYSLTEVLEVGLKTVTGASTDDLEELKSRRDELEHERYVIDSRLNIINEKIEILEQEQSEVAEAKATEQNLIEQAVTELYDYCIESYYSRDWDKVRVRFLAKKYGIPADTIIDFIQNKADQDEIRAKIHAAKAEC